jgi:hypothetical protein
MRNPIYFRNTSSSFQKWPHRYDVLVFLRCLNIVGSSLKSDQLFGPHPMNNDCLALARVIMNTEMMSAK